MKNKMPEITIPNCNHCGTQLVQRETKNARIIYACPNWRKDGTGCAGTIYDPNSEESRNRIYPRVVIRHNVPSKSEPGKLRTVSIHETGDMNCNCLAGEMGKLCRHKKDTGKWLKDLVRKLQEVNNIDFDNIKEEKKPKPKEKNRIL